MATAAQVTTVFAAWRSTRPNPAYCRLTNTRKKLIRARLAEYTVEDLLTVIRWANEADEPGPRWLRGGNPQQQEYLDLTNLFRVTKMPQRVEAALLWRDQADAKAAEEDEGVDLGAFAFVRPQGGQR